MFQRVALFAILTAFILPGGCKKKSYDWESGSDRPSRPWQPDPGPDEWRPQKWVWLGAVEVRHRSPRIGRIYPGSTRGRFRQLRLTVNGGEVEIYDVFVELDNGSRLYPEVRQTLGGGTRTRMLDLPGTVRGIREVRFHCRCVSKHERATISLFAR
jgi:hypothetical protein